MPKDDYEVVGTEIILWMVALVALVFISVGIGDNSTGGYGAITFGFLLLAWCLLAGLRITGNLKW